VEDKNETLFKLEQLCALTRDTEVIPELSNFLIVEAWVVRLRFQPLGWGIFGVLLCNCHPHTAHEGKVEHEDLWERVILCEPPTEDNEFYRRLAAETWTCVLLFEGSGDSSGLNTLLVVDVQEQTAQRIGTITVRGDQFDFLPKKRQRIRLG
jgi:hypothetical protein